MVNRENVHDLVRLIYKPTCKTFYINSIDGKEISKPTGVFVSLGMTTSYKTLENIRDVINGSSGYSACLAEISSVKVDDQFVNTVTNKVDPKQYFLSEIPEDILEKDAAEKELLDLKEQLNPQNSLESITEISPRVAELQRLVDRLTESNGWDSHLIQKIGTKYRIYHRFVNYEKRDGIEYRLGILVNEKETTD